MLNKIIGHKQANEHLFQQRKVKSKHRANLSIQLSYNLIILGLIKMIFSGFLNDILGNQQVSTQLNSYLINYI